MIDPEEFAASVTPPWVMLHGLFGDRDNLRSLAQRLEHSRPVLRLDLAGHGDEPAPERLNFDSLADHAVAAMTDAGITRCHLLGHSLGGKVAMTLAGRLQQQGRDDLSLASLTVLDIAPKAYAPHHRPLLSALHALDLDTVTTRSDAEAALRVSIPHAGTRAFLLKSLKRHGDRWQWAFALERLVADYDELALAPPLIEAVEGRDTLPALFIRGTHSDYLLDEDLPLLHRYYPQAQLQAVEAGHWLHAEKPAEIAALCERFVAGVS